MRISINVLVALAAAVAALAGCMSNPHADAGKRFSAEGRMELALPELEQAAREVPGDIEVRVGLERARTQLANRYSVEGENARVTGQFDVAEAAFRKALGVVKDHPRATQGLRQLEIDRRHEVMVALADSFIQKGDLAAAEPGLRTVLAQNGSHPGARRLLKEIERQRAAASAAASINPALAKPVTLEFRDTPIRSVFEILSRTSGINFVFDKDVKPDTKVSIFVRNSSVDEVMKLVLATNQLESKRLNDNSMLIYPASAAKHKDYQELVVKSFYLANTDVKQAQALIKSIVKSKDVFADERLNLIVIKDTADAVRLAEKVLESLDVAEPEVMLEVEVLEISRNKLLELGPQFPEQVGYGKITPDVVNTTVTTTGTGTSTVFGGVLAPGNIDLRHRNGLTSYVANPGILLNLKDHDGNSRILANPRIRVKNREKAKILIGDKVPVFTTTSTANVGVSSSVTYLDVGLKLEVEPNVSLDSDVSIKVGLEVSSIAKEVAGPGGSIAYQIGTRNADTNLRLRDGETQVLAGLINDEERSSANRLPGLGDVPVAGRLFSSQRVSNSKTEIVLLITPHVLRNLARPEAVEPTIPSGTDSNIGVAPLLLKSSTGISMKSTGGGGAVADSAEAAPLIPDATVAPVSETAPTPAPTDAAPAAEPVVPSPAVPPPAMPLRQRRLGQPDSN